MAVESHATKIKICVTMIKTYTRALSPDQKRGHLSHITKTTVELTKNILSPVHQTKRMSSIRHFHSRVTSSQSLLADQNKKFVTLL